MDLKSFIKNNSGQLTIVGLLLMFLVIVVLASLMPTILVYVTTMAANLTSSGFVTSATMVNFIPLFLVVVLLATIAMYGGPQIR